MSPTTAICSPSSLPNRCRMVRASSKPLGGVLVGAIAAVDHWDADPRGNPPWRPGRLVTHHHQVGTHRLQRLHRVLEALPLGDTPRCPGRSSSCRRRAPWPPPRTTAGFGSMARRRGSPRSSREARGPWECARASTSANSSARSSRSSMSDRSIPSSVSRWLAVPIRCPRSIRRRHRRSGPTTRSSLDVGRFFPT